MSMNRRIAAASTDVSTVVRIINETTGVPETGVGYADAGVSFKYRREEEDNVPFSLVNTVTALDSAHADGGFFHIGNGYYRLDIPDAAFVANPDVDGMGVLIYGAFDNVVVIGTYYDLLPVPGPATKAEMDTAFDDIKGTTFDAATDSLEAIKDNTAWNTAVPPTVGEIADAVWNEDPADHLLDDTYGKVIGDEGAGLKTLCENALQTYDLDHLTNSAATEDIVADSYLDQMMRPSGVGTYDRADDSLKAIRDRGDAAWTTGGGGSSVDRLLLVSTTIASTTSNTEFVLSEGSSDDNAYNNCTIVIERNDDENQKSVCLISGYTVDGSTKTITLEYAPVFTMVATDKVYILAENSLKATARDDKFSLVEIVDAVWDEPSTEHDTPNSYGKSIGTAGAGLTAVPWNALWDDEVQSECNDALVALNLDRLVSLSGDGEPIAENSYLDLMMRTGAEGDYARTTDSLQGIRDNIKPECEGALQTYDLDHLAGSAGDEGSESPVVDSYLDLMMTKASDGPQPYDRATDSLQGSRDTLPEANQLKMDLSSTKFTTIVNNIAAMTRPALPTGTTTGTPTATSIPSDLSETNTDAYKDLWILFTEGNCNKMARKITAYNGSSKTFTVESFPIAPENDKKFVIVNN